MDEADRYRVTPEEHERIFREVLLPNLGPLKRCEHPRAIILGGQPGAGKSAMQSAAEHELRALGGSLAIVGDDLRALHPKYFELLRADDKTAAFYTDRDSGLWVEKLISHAAGLRHNLVIEGTMRIPEKVLGTMREVREHGYAVDVRAITVDGRWSTLGIYQRYERQLEEKGHGRFTLPAAHEAAYAAMPSTIEQVEQSKLAERVGVYARGNLLLYENVLQNEKWSRAPLARAAVERERSRAWTPAEKLVCAAGWDRVVSQMRLRRTDAEQLSLATKERGGAHLELHRDLDAKDMLRGGTNVYRFRDSERIAASHAALTLPAVDAARVFPALAPYMAALEQARRAGAGRTPQERTAALQPLLRQIERRYPEPPQLGRSRGRRR